MGSVIKHAATPLEGYMTGFTINAVILVASGLLGPCCSGPTASARG